MQGTVSEDDRVGAYCRMTAPHKGEAFGMQANVQPIAFDGTLMFRVSYGKVVEA